MTKQKEALELLPCPFCGNKGLLDEFCDDINDPFTDKFWRVDCALCPIKTYDQSTPEEAIAIWNTRLESRDSQVIAEFVQQVNERIINHAGMTVGKGWLLSTMQAVAKERTAPSKGDKSILLDQTTLMPCPTRGNLMCTITDKDHLHIFSHMVEHELKVLKRELGITRTLTPEEEKFLLNKGHGLTYDELSGAPDIITKE